MALLVVALLAMQPRELECGKAAKATPRCEPERRRLPYAASQQRTAAFRRKACSDVETTDSVGSENPCEERCKPA